VLSRVAVALLTIAVLAPPPTAAQADAPPPGSRNWFSRLLPRPPARTVQTAVLPSATSIMLNDQRRESRLEKMASDARIARDKNTRLAELRQERDRRVTAAIARAAPAAPFRPPAPQPGIVVTDTSTPAPADQSIPSALPPSPQTVRLPPRTAPLATTAPARPAPTATPPRAPAPAPAANNTEAATGAAVAAKTTPPGLYALALIGMCLVPALGVGLLMIGFAHLRGHSFVSGTAIMIAGALVLWGSVTAARLINPDLLAFGRDNKQARLADGEESPSVMSSLRSDAFWNAD